jgi:DNA-binding transcriptional MerR regulator
MPNAGNRQSATPARFRAGAAARLAGIRADTLRAWERRYGVVGPETSGGGHRLYSGEDVARITLLKQLVDLGHAIGSIARLPLAELRALREREAGLAEPASEVVRIAAVGPSLAVQLGATTRPLAGLDVVAACAHAESARVALRGRAVDTAVVDMPTLGADACERSDRLAAELGARRLVVLYRFGPEAVVRALRVRGHLVARAPLDNAELARLCRAAVPGRPAAAARAPLDDPPPPRFEAAALAQLAQATPAMLCECPRHVSELLASLSAFEAYSAQCQSRSPADADVHDYLRRAAGSARVMLEDALVRLAAVEGIAVPAAAPTQGAVASGRSSP